MTDKKELKKRYRMRPLTMGLYKITNLASGRVFIGSGKDLPGKMNSARFQLETGSHMNRELQREYKELGGKSFSFEVLDILKPREDPAFDHTEELELLYRMWIEKLKPFGKRGYHEKAPSG